MKVADIRRLRLAGQRLTGEPFTSAVRAVRALGAVQAQEYFGAKWALAQRAGGLTEERVERDFAAGRILRTHVLRPTWHFVAPADIRWMLALTGPRVSAALASYNRKLELTPAVFRRSTAVIERALSGGKHLTRAELAQALRRARFGEVRGQRLGRLVMQAELDAVICSGPRRGKQFTYALLDERVPPAPVLDAEEALVTLTRRYFATRSPATVHDFAWWSGLRVGDARRGIEIAGRTLEKATIEGREYWIARDAPRPRTLPATVHLLPAYDEYFIGFRDRSSIAQRIGTAALATGANVLLPNVIVAGGELIGGWRWRPSAAGRVLTIELLSPLRGGERTLLERARERFFAFVGERPEA